MMKTAIPMILAASLDRMNAARATGLERIQAAVPDCFSPIISSWARMIVPMTPAAPASEKKRPNPSSRGSVWSGGGAAPAWAASLWMVGTRNRINATNPLMIATQITVWISQRRVPSQSSNSLPNMLLKPPSQGLPWTGWSAARPGAVASCCKVVLAAILVAPFDEAEEHFFQVIDFAPEGGHGDGGIGQDEA